MAPDRIVLPSRGHAAAEPERQERTIDVETTIERRSGLWRFAPLALIACGLVAIWATGWHDRLTLEHLVAARDRLQALAAAQPLMAPAGFMLIYALAVGCALPIAPAFTILAGFLFGWMAGALYAMVSVTIGATTLFLASRMALGGFLQRRTGGRAAALAEGFRRDAFGYLVALRLAPVAPSFVVNIGAGLLLVRPGTFVAATLVGILPGRLAYAWLGDGLDGALARARAAGRDLTLSDLVTVEFTVAFILMALVAALAAIVRKSGAARAR